MGAPKNAQVNGDGFRFYEWQDAYTGETTNVLSVTSIRTLVGTPFHLVNWQISNVLDVALDQRKVTVVGPRGGISEKRRKDQYPGEFHRRYIESEGNEGPLEDLRKWARAAADDPRNIPARRGSMVHEAIERRIPWDRIERAWVEGAFDRLSERDRKAAPGGVLDEDVYFVRNAVRQWWDFDRKHRLVMLAREMQVFNLEAGYAGSFDGLAWEAPVTMRAVLPAAAEITPDFIRENGGRLVLIDWKTSPEVYTDHVLQAHAYMGAEFVGSDGVIDHRLTELLLATVNGALVSIRPNKWGLYRFKWNEEAMGAFLGFVAGARFLAKYPKPDGLFYEVETGSSEEVD